MHLAIDALGAKTEGAAVIATAICQAAVHHESLAAVTVFCSPAAARRFDFEPSSKLTVIDKWLYDRVRVLRPAWFGAGLPREVRRRGADAVLCLGGGGRTFDGTPLFTFIQQSLPFSQESLVRSNFMDRLRLWSIRREMRRSVHRAIAVLVQTEAMAATIGPGLSLGRDRIHVFVPSPPTLAVARPEAPVKAMMAATPPDRRVLYVGSDAPYKNVVTVASAMQIVRREVPDATLFVTLPAQHPVCSMDGIVGLGTLSRGDVRRAYELATVVTMPSLTESASLPLLEAMSLERPLVAADRPYAREICRDAAEFVDPLDSDAVARGMLRLLRDPERRCQLASRGRAIAAELERARPYDALIDFIVRAMRRSNGSSPSDN